MWGIIKFSKRIIRPHTVTNNEVLDLLSRIPDDDELVRLLIAQWKAQTYLPSPQIQFRELSLQQPTEAARRDPRKKKQS